MSDGTLAFNLFLCSQDINFLCFDHQLELLVIHLPLQVLIQLVTLLQLLHQQFIQVDCFLEHFLLGLNLSV